MKFQGNSKDSINGAASFQAAQQGGRGGLMSGGRLIKSMQSLSLCQPHGGIVDGISSLPMQKECFWKGIRFF